MTLATRLQSLEAGRGSTVRRPETIYNRPAISGRRALFMARPPRTAVPPGWRRFVGGTVAWSDRVETADPAFDAGGGQQLAGHEGRGGDPAGCTHRANGDSLGDTGGALR